MPPPQFDKFDITTLRVSIIIRNTRRQLIGHRVLSFYANIICYRHLSQQQHLLANNCQFICGAKKRRPLIAFKLVRQSTGISHGYFKYDVHLKSYTYLTTSHCFLTISSSTSSLPFQNINKLRRFSHKLYGRN